MIIWERLQTSLQVCCNIYGHLINVINHEAKTKRRLPGRYYKDTGKLALEREIFLRCYHRFYFWASGDFELTEIREPNESQRSKTERI